MLMPLAEENAPLAEQEELMNKSKKLELIRDTGLIAILRARSSEQLIAAADAIKEGGISVIEVTMTTPGAIDVIKEASGRYEDEILFGVGSVLDPDMAREVVSAGAEFVVAPTLNFEVISFCTQSEIPVIPGCYTPTEALNAWEAGADMIKLFPASNGGPGFIKAIKAPLPHLEVVPVGGVNLDNAADFIRKGAAALGVGSSLVSQELLENRDLDELTRRAKAFVAEIKKARDG